MNIEDYLSKECNVNPDEKISTNDDSWWKLKDLVAGYIEEEGLVKNLTIPDVKNWVTVKDSMPENCDQVFVKYENGKYGINEWWESDDCWKYQFDNMIVKEWCKPPCS